MSVSRDDIFDVLQSIPDPEMPISIVDLGLVEAVRVQMQTCDETSGSVGGRVSIEIDLLPTFIGCPALDMIAGDVRAKIGAIPNVDEVKVNWVFDPPWSVDRITPAGRHPTARHR